MYVASVLYSRLCHRRVKRLHGIELAKLQGGVAPYILSVLGVLLMRQVLQLAVEVVTHVYGYWPLGNLSCQVVGWTRDLLQNTFLCSLSVGVIFRYIVILKELEVSKFCEAIHANAIKKQWLMIVIVVCFWTHLTLAHLTPLYFMETRPGYKHGNCVLMYASQNDFFVHKVIIYLLTAIPITSAALFMIIYTTIKTISYKIYNKNERKTIIDVKFTVSVFLLNVSRLVLIFTTIQSGKRWPEATLKTTVESFPTLLVVPVLVYLFLSITLWPLVRLPLHLLLRDLLCLKPMRNTQPAVLSSTTVAAPVHPGTAPADEEPV